MITLKNSFAKMQVLFPWILVSFLAMVGSSCQKDRYCDTCAAENRYPRVAAGADQTIKLPVDSVWLDGTRSNDPDGTIKAYRWREVAGPAPSQVVKPEDSVTMVRALVAGQYQFELAVTDNGGLSARDTVRVTVLTLDDRNQPPVACAGPDVFVTLPVNTTTLNGRCSKDPDNNISSYRWTKLSGPASFRIANPDQPITNVTDLVVGSFEFLLTVRDAVGLMSVDTVRVTVTPPIVDDGVDIYVAGVENGMPKYWKNGQGVGLLNSKFVLGRATDIAVEGNDIYVAGVDGEWQFGDGYLPKYWKNGEEVFLSNGFYGIANAITLSGNDVYVAGFGDTNPSGFFVAIYWKNGLAVTLTDGTKDAFATDIAVVGSDVYVSGYDGDVARVWRNGKLFWSASGADPSYAFRMTVSGSDIYLAGMVNNKAVYWKNGQVFSLSTGLSSSYSIFVKGTDIYVAGEQDYNDVYWKNGQVNSLSGGGATGPAGDIFVEGNNVYVTSNDHGGYWKNGQFFKLGSNNSYPFSILVKRR